MKEVLKTLQSVKLSLMAHPDYALHTEGEFHDQVSALESLEGFIKGSESMDVILLQIKRERERQNEQWGEQNHKQIEFMAILMEEVGEASKEIVDFHFKNPYKNALGTPLVPDQGIQQARLWRYRQELVQVAAVAVQMIEALDRNKQ